MENRVKGMSFLNPVNIEEGYLKHCAKYAIEHGIRHFEIIGPTHSSVRGNCDGMIFYRKYSEFNSDKDEEYVRYCERVVNETLDMIEPYGIKSYYWHHELEVPLRFDEVYPEIHNSDGDVEVTHPRIRDFLENKIEDFFHAYPKMSGIVLTLHETRIPLLKLKNQKLGKVERVKYVTEILYNACKRLGKELIVRPFASVSADYEDLMSAYEQISSELVVCDKWTQFDWSLVLPHNSFLKRIKNPKVIETDIFGEYFGKGFLPIMLKDHITRKFAECEAENPRGYVSRIDRGGFVPFGTPNEVNLEIMDAVLDGRDVDEAIDEFFRREYGEFAPIVREAMENTEQIQINAMFCEGNPIHWLSHFPRISSMKSRYRYFRDDCVEDIKRSWEYPKGLDRIHADISLDEKRRAIEESERKLALIKTLEGKLDCDKYKGLYTRFLNLNLVCRIWEQLTVTYVGLARYFEYGDSDALASAYRAIDKMIKLDKEGFEALGEEFYCEALHYGEHRGDVRKSSVAHLDTELRRAISIEAVSNEALRAEGLTDYVICGGFSEEHNQRSENNFSFPFVFDDGVCRSAGSERGKEWSFLKAHGWVQYDLKVKPGVENELIISGKALEGTLSFDLSLLGEVTKHTKTGDGILDCSYKFTPPADTDSVTVRIDRNSDFMPYIYTLKVK